MLVDAWENAGIECVQAGTPTEVVLDLAPALASADIVVAKARAALEGMCAGRAVYIYDQYGGDGWVTPDNYPAFEADHFAGQATARPRTGADLVADLAEYSPEMGVVNHELVRSHHGARHHAIELVAILRGAYVREPDQVEVTAEVARLARASGRAEIRSGELWRRMTAAEAQVADARHEPGRRSASSATPATSSRRSAPVRVWPLGGSLTGSGRGHDTDARPLRSRARALRRARNGDPRRHGDRAARDDLRGRRAGSRRVARAGGDLGRPQQIDARSRTPARAGDI